MDISLSSPLSRNAPPFPLSTTHNFQIHRLFSSSLNPNSNSKISSIRPLIWRHNHSIRAQDQNRNPVDNGGFVLKDIPHLTNFLPDLPVAATVPCGGNRKLRMKRVIRVPSISMKLADIPPDDYSWRKYGHKPIKGSPHPRIHTNHRASWARGHR